MIQGGRGGFRFRLPLRWRMMSQRVLYWQPLSSSPQPNTSPDFKNNVA